MPLILDGTNGISDVRSTTDGSAATPAIRGTDTNTGIFFGTDIIGFSEGGVEAARFDSSGNLGLGTTSPTSQLHLAKALSSTQTNMLQIQNTGIFTWGIGVDNAVSNSSLLIQSGGAGGTTRLAIDSSGRLLVGTTSPIGSTFSTIEYSATTYNGLGLNQSTNSGGGRFMLFASQGTQCGVIDRVGTTSAVVYTTTSDRRLKENIVDAPSAIAHINAVKVRSFNWIDGGHQVKYGVIAQEFVEVEPDAVVQGDNGQTIEKSWAVDTAALVPAMIKAIQEQQAIINDLKSRIETLESK